VWTGADDAAALSEGIRRTFIETNLRYSQVAPLSMYEEVNTGDNLPAQIDLYAEPGEEYKFLFIAKGGGSANKSFLYQQTKAVLNPKSLLNSSTKRPARSAPRPARPIIWRSSSAAPRPR